MNPIVLAVLIVAGLALAAGLILAVASVVMAVPRDEKAEALRAVLPGANCGACGYSGCDGYAKAMAHEGAKVGLCSPGGAAVAEATANLLGVEGTLEAKTALVHCGGCEEFAARKLRYSGLPSCAAAAQFYGGDLACSYGCLGYGDCRAVCEYGAITVENGLARIDKDKCAACGLCVKACPSGAVKVENFLAAIDPEICTGCGACAAVCPSQCISVFGLNEGKAAETQGV